MPSLRTEKAIKAAIAAKGNCDAGVLIKQNGNHVIVFEALNAKGESTHQIARFTLRQIIGKRYPAKKKR